MKRVAMVEVPARQAEDAANAADGAPHRPSDNSAHDPSDGSGGTPAFHGAALRASDNALGMDARRQKHERDQGRHDDVASFQNFDSDGDESASNVSDR